MAMSGGGHAGIFISYRRADASWPALWLADRLGHQFGTAVVFQDVDSIRPGDDFAAEIEAAVGACSVLLAVIGPQWLAAEGDARRLDDPQDWVRLEIEAAMKREIRIIPVLVDGARMPSAGQLPPSLRDLARRQAVTLSPESLDTRRLVSVLETALPPPAPALPTPSPVTTDTWQYTSDGQKASAARMATESAMPGTGYQVQPGDRPPWIRFIVLIPCSQISPDTSPGQLWSDFMRFLKDQPVISLVNGLTHPVAGVRWTRWASRSAGTIQAIFTPGQESEAVASARLELPDDTRRDFHDFASAVLILHFEPPVGNSNAPLPAGPVSWTDHMMRALELPNALNRLLTQQLGLSTSGDPQVVLGFRLDAPNDLTEIIDITDLAELPGGQHGSQAIGYFIADPAGAGPAEVVTRMINHVLMYALQAER
jgi:TIR domain